MDMEFREDEINGAIEKLKGIDAKRILVQFPEGLKTKIQSMSKQLENEGFEVFICTESCYGACDIRDSEAKRLECDAILHIGHADFGVKSSVPVVYIEYKLESDPVPILERELHKLDGFENLGLVTSLQYVDSLGRIKDFLEKHGKKVFMNKTLKYPGQILGCDLGAALSVKENVDCFLCITAGKFYGLGLVMKTGKPAFSLDLEKGVIENLDAYRKKFQKVVAWNMSEFDDAKRIGILVSWKHGQIKDSFELKKRLEERGKEVSIFAMDEITPEKLIGIDVDFLVNTACPRIGIDDFERYEKPILNVEDIEL